MVRLQPQAQLTCLGGGTTTVHQGGTFDLSPNGDLTLSGGGLTSDGTVKADEITVNSKDSELQLNAETTANKLTASAGTVSLGANSTTNITGELKADGGTINSSGTTTAGKLTVDQGTNPDGTTRQGEVNITGGTTTVKGDTEIKSGSVAVETAGKLATEGTLKVGDKAGDEGTATLT
ncbi:hypothetical protein QV06_06495, partial [Gallibacterium genomosp. 3]